jgi:SOS-response transcriptional repressor LexA
LIAVRASGNSMNDAQVLTAGGRKAPINDGDYVIVDRQQLSLQDNINKYVLSIIGGMANIKKLVHREYDIALLSESTDQKAYPPIIIHEGDDYLVNGRVIQVVEA